MANRRNRRRGSHGGALLSRRLALVILAAFFLLGVLLPTGAFSLVDASRIGSIGVSGDSNAELGMNVFTCIGSNSVDPLVTITNNLEESVDVTVSLVDTGEGTLLVGGQSGDSVTFSLGVGASETVEMDAASGGPFPRPFEFTIEAVGSDTTVTATRSSQVDNNCGSSTPSPTPTATATPVPGNDPPIAEFTMNRKGNSNNVDVDASASSDPDGSIVTYEWDVGADGTIEETGQTATLRVSPGTPIKLIVTDNSGGKDSTTQPAE